MKIYELILFIIWLLILICGTVKLIDNIKQTEKEKKEWKKIREREFKYMEENIMKERKYNENEIIGMLFETQGELLKDLSNETEKNADKNDVPFSPMMTVLYSLILIRFVAVMSKKLDGDNHRN